MARWEIDSAHSGLWFSVRHMALARIRGRFSRWSGHLLADDAGLHQATVSILIDASSITTGLEDRDAHLRSRAFLDTETYPDMTFQGQVLAAPRGRRFRLTGALTALGRALPMALPIESTGRALDPWGHERAGFSARASLDRRRLGPAWNQRLCAGGFLLGDQVDFEIDVEAVRQEPPTSGPEAIRAGTPTLIPRSHP